MNQMRSTPYVTWYVAVFGNDDAADFMYEFDDAMVRL